MSALACIVAGERIELWPERVAHWTARATLILSDLHWGKSETLQRIGIPLPSEALAADLATLERLVVATGAKRLLVLGDLVHARRGLTPEVVATVAAWRARVPIELAVLRGNHDRGIAWPEAWDVRDQGAESLEAPFRFAHEPEEPRDVDAPGEAPGLVTWYGHVHPCVVLRSGVDRARLPCFLVGPRRVLLPAFGLTTGAMPIQAEDDDRVLVIAGDEVVEVAAAATRRHAKSPGTRRS